jgi:hypothetical protein
MKRSIGTPLALFGFLLAAAMVCTTSAQAPNAATTDQFFVLPAVAQAPNQHFPITVTLTPDGSKVDKIEIQTDTPRPAAQPAPKSDAPTVDPFPSTPRRPVRASGHETPLVVGRYQAVSHNGKLIVLDTATGECFRLNGIVWENSAPPIEGNATPTPTAAPKLPESTPGPAPQLP